MACGREVVGFGAGGVEGDGVAAWRVVGWLRLGVSASLLSSMSSGTNGMVIDQLISLTCVSNSPCLQVNNYILLSHGSSLMSNTFISLVHCLWLLAYLVVSVIGLLVLPWSHPYWYCYYFYIIYILKICMIIVFSSGVLSSSLVFFIVCWSSCSIREYTSTYILLSISLSVVFYVIIGSESMFFITIFGSLSDVSCSSVWSLDGFQVSDSIQVAFSITVLLSVGGLFFSCARVNRGVHMLRHSSLFIVSLIAFIFVSVQIKEFRNVT